jgi:transposase
MANGTTSSNLIAYPTNVETLIYLRILSVLELTPEEKSELRRRAASPTSTQRDALRARIVLLRTQGRKEADVAKELGANVNTVSLWSKRFEAGGLEALSDRKGRGRKPWLPPEKVRQVISRVTQPPKGRKKWSTRRMAAEVGISHHSVHEIWRRNDLKPHLVRTFKISNDPKFEEKFWDVIGLYLNPPDRSLVLCCDEKSQCQALERTQPGLPLGIGHIRTRTHDYKRHGTITLFAALNYLEGKLITRTESSHTHVEWLRFLKQIDKETPKALAVHVIADNYATHKHANVKAWLKKHPRFSMHFTPTGSSWMNLVERFFADLTGDCIREGSFRSVRELIDAIEEYLADRNASPKRYVWRAKGEEILRKIAQAKEVLVAQLQPAISNTSH